jgi:hypothetical protein
VYGREDVGIDPAQNQRDKNGKDDRNVDGNDILNGLF